jgi:multidrug transporter EmrE-like cation transporter
VTIWSHAEAMDGRSVARRRSALWTLYLALPWLGLGYQIAAKKTASALVGMPLGWPWLETAARSPWGQSMLLLEVASFVAWMRVLAEMKLSAAFPLSAASYVLVIAASWFYFHEPGNVLQVMGSAAILAGVWLISRSPETGE